jgi:hypothetical protein
MLPADFFDCAYKGAGQLLPSIDLADSADEAMPTFAVVQPAFAPLILGGQQTLHLPKLGERRVGKQFGTVEGHVASPSFL